MDLSKLEGRRLIRVYITAALASALQLPAGTTRVNVGDLNITNISVKFGAFVAEIGAESGDAETMKRVGKPIRDFQAIEFMLADMAVEIMAAKSMLYRIGAQLDQGMDRKIVHARASALKLYCSEMAGRVIDKAVQILGGRGYMRENPVERLYRDIRVERIWEGTSEIQRMVVGGQIKKRGLGIYTGWD